MLSILIPTYNTNVTELVSSLLKQCSNEQIDFEICIIDDASTLETLTAPQNKYVNYSKNQDNIGRTATRNLLAKKATYDWLLFLDADTLPVSKDFIKKYIHSIKSNSLAQIIYGGLLYEKKRPKPDKILRWKYGHQKEAKSVLERLKTPEFITSLNLLIKKDAFLLLNKFHENIYGIDNVFSNLIKKEKINVFHINNPVFHLGLEASNVFLNKSLRAIDSTIYFEEKNLLDNDSRPIQKAYLLLEKIKLSSLFFKLIKLLLPIIKYNLESSFPNIFLFDLYRLYYYIKRKKQ